MNKAVKKSIFIALPVCILTVIACISIKAITSKKEEVDSHEQDIVKTEVPEPESISHQEENSEEIESTENEEIKPEAETPGEEVQVAEQPDDCNYAGLNTGNTGTTKVRVINCVKTVYYQIEKWGTVETNLEDFRSKVAETLQDARGWSKILAFKEVQDGADVHVIISDPASLDVTPGCSGELSCTNWSNQVIINDIRWREGTESTRAAGMSTRDYQHMVLNHEMGHWLGHYAHVESCPNGGPAPIMLQQSTGLRGCSSANAWPLDSELWTLR